MRASGLPRRRRRVAAPVFAAALPRQVSIRWTGDHLHLEVTAEGQATFVVKQDDADSVWRLNALIHRGWSPIFDTFGLC